MVVGVMATAIVGSVEDAASAVAASVPAVATNALAVTANRVRRFIGKSP
jgi:hypothetical protein